MGLLDQLSLLQVTFLYYGETFSLFQESGACEFPLLFLIALYDFQEILWFWIQN